MIEINLLRFCTIVAEAKSQDEILIGLYKMVFPDWDRIEELKGWPSCSNITYDLIAHVCHQFDRKHHPEVISGGMWMNWGFTIDDDVPDWEIDDSSCDVILKEPQEVEHV